MSGAQQRSGDAAAAAAANADVISSGAVAADGTARRTSSVNRSAGAAGGGSHGTAAAAAAAAAGGSGGSRGNTGSGQLRGGSFRSGGGVAPGEQEAISQEDDSEPVPSKGASSGRGGRSGSGGRKSGSVPCGAAGGAMLGVTGGEGAADAEGEPLAGAVTGDNEQLGDADDADADYDGMMTGRRSDEGVGEEGGDAAMMCAPIMPRRVRQVPRQSSAINLGTRAGPAEMKRMAAEVESLRGENQLLHMQLQRMQQQQTVAQAGGGSQQQQPAAAGGRETGGQYSPQAEGSAAGCAGAGAGGGGGSSSRLDALEREMAVLKQQVGYSWCLPGRAIAAHTPWCCQECSCACTQLPFAAVVSDAPLLHRQTHLQTRV